MITALIIDDELHARDYLLKLIYRYFDKQITVVDCCESVGKGVSAIRSCNPDLVFLDIHMPEENGLELFKYFDKITFEVIFTTAYNDFAIEAIRHSALDYLLKPVNQVDLFSAVKRFENKKEQSRRDERISILLENLNADDSFFNKIALPTQNGYEFVKIPSILYCKSDSNYCKVILIDGKVYFLSKTLKYVEELIGSDLFFRIHKSYLVNLNYVSNYSTSEASIALANNEKLPVSVRKKDPFLKAMLRNK